MTFVDASSLKLSPICCPHTPVDQSREGPEKITELKHRARPAARASTGLLQDKEHFHTPDLSRHYRSLLLYNCTCKKKAKKKGKKKRR
jgi:hypothetical protein